MNQTKLALLPLVVVRCAVEEFRPARLIVGGDKACEIDAGYCIVANAQQCAARTVDLVDMTDRREREIGDRRIFVEAYILAA